MTFLKMSARWCFDFTKWSPTKTELLIATSCVQQEEKDRLARFVFKNDFKSSLIGRLMMRKYIHESIGLAYDEINIKRDAKGKPYIDDGTVSFNVSHQGNFAVFAGESDGLLLGVDVMKQEYSGGKPLGEFFRLMTRHFSPSEWHNIKSGTDAEQIAKFCRHWCLKESYVKAIGVGITVNLQEISFKPEEGLCGDSVITNTELYVRNEKQDWFFEESNLDDDHCVAVASKIQRTEPIIFRKITFDELVETAVPFLPEDHMYCEKFFDKLDKK